MNQIGTVLKHSDIQRIRQVLAQLRGHNLFGVGQQGPLIFRIFRCEVGNQIVNFTARHINHNSLLFFP